MIRLRVFRWYLGWYLMKYLRYNHFDMVRVFTDRMPNILAFDVYSIKHVANCMQNISYGYSNGSVKHISDSELEFVGWLIWLFWKKNRQNHDDVIKWKHFPRYWPFVRGIHRSPVNSPHKGQWRGALMFFICAWINARGAGGLRRYRAHYDVIGMFQQDDTVHGGSGQSTAGLVTTTIRQQSVYCVNTLRPSDTYVRQ